MKSLNLAIAEGIITIIESENKRFEMEVNDIDIMVHYDKDFFQLKKGMKVRIVGKCFTGGIIAEHIEVADGKTNIQG